MNKQATFALVGYQKYPLKDVVRIFRNELTSAIVLADGSTCSNLSELGAAIITQIVGDMLLTYDYKRVMDHKEFLRRALVRANSFLLDTGSTISALDTTLVYVVRRASKIDAVIWGDGCLFYKKKNMDVLDVHLVESPTDGDKSYPFYPRYFLSNKDFSSIPTKKIKTRASSSPNISLIEEKLSRDIAHYSFNTDELSLIGISSDGISTFKDISKLGDPFFTHTEMLDKIISFKHQNMDDNFVKNKLEWLLRRSANIVPLDDLSIGVLCE